jgi:Secretion system C-terminal sorting domain
MKKIYTFFIFSFFNMCSFGQCLTNYLTNASFEAPIQPGLGNNFPPPNNTFGGWNIPTATVNVPAGGFNVIKVDGTGYSGGPNTGHDGNQYVDVNGAAGIVEQSFTLTCPSTNIEFGGWYSRREPGGAGFTNNIEVLNSASVVVATSSSVSFTNNESEETWKQVTGVATNLPAGVYRFRFIMDDYANVDDAFLCATTGCILPVKLSAFSFSNINCIAKLNWSTASENDLKFYEIQASTNGNNFKSIGTIDAKNVSTGSNYSFVDLKNTDNNFYRLKIIETNGVFYFSEIIKANFNCKSVYVSVYPNPTSDVLHIFSNSIKFTKTSIFSIAGKNVFNTTIGQGNNIISIKNLPTGIYLVKIISSQNTEVFRITKN